MPRRARYECPALTVTVLRSQKSRTRTVPVLTCVRVPLHESVILNLVPRTVAALLRPRTLKWPFTLLNRLRRLRFRAAASFGDPPGGSFPHDASPPPVIDSVVSGFLRP